MEPAEGASSSEEGEAPRKHKKKKKGASDEGEAAEAPTGPAATALDVSVGPRFLWRNLTWSPKVPTLSGYSIGHAPGFGAFIAWYPAAHFRGGWVSNVGIATSIEYTPGLVSQTGAGVRYPTSESDYWAGLRGRLIFGPAQVALTLGGGQHSFIFHGDGTAAMRQNLADLPDVQYTYARIGVDLRVTLPANFALMVGGAYRHVVSAGDNNFLIQANQYFPSSKFIAFDAMAAVGYKVFSMLEARAGFDLRRYQMTAGTNAYMVTGATDQYVALWLQAALMIDGYRAGEGGPAAAKPAPAARPEKSDGDDAKGADE